MRFPGKTVRNWRGLILGTLAGLLVCASFPAAQAPTSAAQAASTLQGTVRDSQGRPVAGAAVVLQAEGAAKPLTTFTADDGTYTFSALAAGAYSVKSQKAGLGEAANRSVRLSPGEKKQMDLTLEPPGAPPEAGARGASSQAIQFADEPQFTVAGLTDWTSAGGHGSDTRLRAAETLSQDTRSLAKEPAGKNAAAAGAAEAPAPEPTASKELLRERQEREQLRAALALHNSADLHRRLADLDERLGDPLEAVREYQQAVRLDPSEQNFFDWGTELLLHRASGPAAEVFTQGHQAHPRSARMLMGLGVAYYARGSYPEAVRWLSAAAALDPANPNPYLFLGKMESASSTPLVGVEEPLARFARLHPANAWANYYAALSLWKRQRVSENPAAIEPAERLLDKALELDPQLAEAWILRGNFRAEQHDWSAAVRAYQRAAEIRPHLDEAHYRLALAYRRMGKEADAQREVQIHEQETKEQAAQTDRRRREIQQFVIVWRGQPPDWSPR